MESILDAYKNLSEKDKNNQIEKIIDPQYGDITNEVSEALKNYQEKIDNENRIMSERKNKYLKDMEEKKSKEIKTNNNSLFNIEKLVKEQRDQVTLKDEEKPQFVIEEHKANNGAYEDDFDELSEDELNIKREDVKIYVEHAYCPNCGEEIISKGPSMYNPLTMEAASFYICERCRKKMKLKNSFPKLVITDSNNNKIKAYGE